MKVKDLFRKVEYPISLFDKNGNKIYYEESDGYWYKKGFDSNNNEIYFESSTGYIMDRIPKTRFTVKEIEEKLGISNIEIIGE